MGFDCSDSWSLSLFLLYCHFLCLSAVYYIVVFAFYMYILFREQARGHLLGKSRPLVFFVCFFISHLMSRLDVVSDCVDS